MQKKNRIKMLSYALALSLSTASLGGCSDAPNNFSYTTNTEGEFEVSGNITHKILKDYKLIELKVMTGDNKLFIASEHKVSGRYIMNRTYYNDIFSGETIYDTAIDDQKLEIVNKYELIDWLVTYDEVRGSYSIEDIQRLYDKILEDYEFEKEKTLEK